MSKQWKHRVDKNRLVGSDFERICKIQNIIPVQFHPLQHRTIKTPKGKYPQRKPDLTITMSGFIVPVELDGGVHGYNDEISESKQTKTRNDDYMREGYLPIIINHEQLKELNILEEQYIKHTIIALEPLYRTKKRLRLEKLS